MGKVMQMFRKKRAFLFTWDNKEYTIPYDDIERFIIDNDIELPPDVIRMIVGEWFLMKTEDSK